MHGKKRIILVLTILTLSLLMFGCGNSDETQSAAEVKKVPVTVQTIVKGDMKKTVEMGGLLQPHDEVRLSSNNPANKVVNVAVQEGDYVLRGTPLVLFDSRNIDLSLEQTTRSYERNKQLFEQGAISKSQMEQIEDGLKSVQLQKENTIITSPINGVVSSVSAVEGQLAGSMPLVSVVNIDRLKLVLQVGETNISKLKMGNEMSVSIPAASKDAYVGLITNIAPHVDSMTKAYPVTVEILNESKAVKGGMYGEVELVIERKEDVLVIPQNAILDYEQSKIVFVVEEGKAVQREVKVGITLGDEAEIKEGLQEGEELIVEGQYGIKDGTDVNPFVRGEEQ